MGVESGIGSGAAGLWYRVEAVGSHSLGGSADSDYASVLPAILTAARHRRPFIAGWLSRGGGAPLELITNAGPLPPAGSAPSPAADGEGDAAAAPSAPRGVDLLFPWGARGAVIDRNMLADLDRLVWAPCPGRHVPPVADAGRMAFGGGPGLGGGGLGGAGLGGGVLGGGVLGGGVLGGAVLGGAGLGGAVLGPPTLFESALETLIGRPFGWLIVADPTDQLDAEVADLRDQLTALRRYDDERARVEADRAERRLAELDAYRDAGLWHVRVLAGAATEQDLRLIAPVLVGSADLRAHQYLLRCPDGAQEFADALAAKVADTADGSMVPFAATAGVLTALTGLPRREMPGVRVTRPGCFGVTAMAAPSRAVELGDILDGQDRPVGAMRIPLATLNRHALVAGATGAGKSQTIRHLLAQLTEAGVGWLAVEPVKSEYAATRLLLAGHAAAALEVTDATAKVTDAMAKVTDATAKVTDAMAEVTDATAEVTDAPGGASRTAVMIINPADPESVPLSVSPLAPEPGYPVQAHIDMVRALFLAVYDAPGPFPEIMSQALQRSYEECGWDPLTGGGRADSDVRPAVPTLARLQAAALAVIDEASYGRELHADVRGFVDGRLKSLRTGPASQFLEGGHPADVGALLERNVVLALGGVTSDEDKAFVIGALVIKIVEHLRLRARAELAAVVPKGTSEPDELRHVIVLEEAHRLLPARRSGASAHAVELFAGLLAEIGAYGEGVVMAEQIPAKLVPDAIKNTALKILHRLPGADDRQLVGATMNLDADQSRHVVSLPSGQAAVFADGMDRPVRVQVPLAAAGDHRPAAAMRPVSGVLAGRRSTACGSACTAERPCTLVEIRAADLVARSPRDAWLRVWTEVYVLAHLTNQPRPRVPVPLRQRWATLGVRLRECALATAIDAAVLVRGQALRESYDPAGLAAALAVSAAAMLDGGKGAGTRPGTSWVIPQLRWLHELERVCPHDGPAPDPFAAAPALDYALSDLGDRADVKIGQRISALRRHQLSMEVTRNRLIAWCALLGENDQSAFIEDLATVAIGVSHRGQLGKAAGEMGVTGWLEAVLSWPRRFIVGADDQTAMLSSPEPAPVAG